jgi:hypothetical protein
MQTSISSPPAYSDSPPSRLSETAFSAISWSAILGGVFVALAVSVVLTILGSGLGFAAKSPWVDASAAKTLGVISVIWIIVVQWLGSALGGYITGRLRTRWVNVHTHEVFFRDTAHGFVTWAVATVVMLAIFTSIASVAGHAGTNITAHALSGYVKGNEAGIGSKAQGLDVNPMSYYSDMLFRGGQPTASVPTQGATSTPAVNPNEDVRAEANRILFRGLKDNGVSDEDKAYLTQLVSIHTGLSDTDARKRVDSVIEQESADEAHVKEVADNARKTASVLSICIALSLMLGAFVASVAAALGGNARDRHN